MMFEAINAFEEGIAENCLLFCLIAYKQPTTHVSSYKSDRSLLPHSRVTRYIFFKK